MNKVRMRRVAMSSAEVSIAPITTSGTSERPGARFTKYLTTILRLSYDNAKVTIDLRWTSNLQNILTKGARLFLGTIHLQSCKIVRDSVHKLAYHVPKKEFEHFFSHYRKSILR